jgi:hypothetical protein
MKRRILIAIVILSLALTIVPASASIPGSVCDYWAYRFWAAMAANNAGEASFNYSQWLSCTAHRMAGR